MPPATKRASASTTRPASVSCGLRLDVRSNKLTPSCASRLLIV